MLAERFEVFRIDSIPEKIDVLAWLRDPIQDVKNIRVWSTTTSDVNGCESWVASKPLTFERDLLSHDCPALTIIDRLRELEYVARDVKQTIRNGQAYITIAKTCQDEQRFCNVS